MCVRSVHARLAQPGHRPSFLRLMVLDDDTIVCAVATIMKAQRLSVGSSLALRLLLIVLKGDAGADQCVAENLLLSQKPEGVAVPPGDQRRGSDEMPR